VSLPESAKETIETIGEIKRKNSPATAMIEAAGCRKPIENNLQSASTTRTGCPPPGCRAFGAIATFCGCRRRGPGQLDYGGRETRRYHITSCVVAMAMWMTALSRRFMVGLDFLIFGLGLLSLLTRALGTLHGLRLLHGFTVAMGPAGFLAVLAGWFTTETGRQPFTVYDLLRTAKAASPHPRSAPRSRPSPSSISRSLDFWWFPLFGKRW
jgi:cytochrome bd-type quinol oxidase subunit 1